MKNRVWPSGAAPVRSRSAGMKLPPARFSTKTVVRMFSLIFCATSRAMTSVAPPAASPTIILIGLPEKSCAFTARAGAQASARPATRTKADRSCMRSSLAMWRPFFGFSLAVGEQRRHDALARQRQIANARAERPRHRVADGGRGWTERGLAQAQRRLVRRVDE